MITPARILRLFKIHLTIVRYGLDELLFTIPAFRPVHFVLRLLPWHWMKRKLPLATRIRLALEELGPVFIKFGQTLSTRRDLLPADIADELAKLQDQVPPFCGIEAREIVEVALGAPVDTLFAGFDTTPLAAASVAQVHAAKLMDGADVVVKVLRPDARKRIKRDIDVLKWLARTATLVPGVARLRPEEVVREYETTIFNELDLMREAANAGQLRRNFEGSTTLYVPKIYWNLCSGSVIVMERIYGIPISDIRRLRAAGTDMRELAQRGVEIFFTQVFEHNFFHADMHPGNLFVRVDDPARPVYAGVDFGIMGMLSKRDQFYLAENFLAFFNHDYKRIAMLHIESGWVPSDVREDEFEASIRTVCEPLARRPMNEISFGHLLIRLFRTGRRFNMEVQPQLLLLQKTLLNVEGLGRELYPELDLWVTAKPFFERWSAQQSSITGIIKGVFKNGPRALEHLPVMPKQLWRTLRSLDDYARRRNDDKHHTYRLHIEIRKAARRIVYALIFAAAVIAFALYKF